MPAAQPVMSKSGVRRWRRFHVTVPMRVIVQKDKRVVILDGRGSALNEGGLTVYVGAEFKIGDKVHVEFTPAYAAPPIRVEAQVCNRSGYNYGVEFLAATPAQQEQAAQMRNHLSTLAEPAGG